MSLTCKLGESSHSGNLVTDAVLHCCVSWSCDGTGLTPLQPRKLRSAGSPTSSGERRGRRLFLPRPALPLVVVVVWCWGFLCRHVTLHRLAGRWVPPRSLVWEKPCWTAQNNSVHFSTPEANLLSKPPSRRLSNNHTRRPITSTSRNFTSHNGFVQSPRQAGQGDPRSRPNRYDTPRHFRSSTSIVGCWRSASLASPSTSAERTTSAAVLRYCYDGQNWLIGALQAPVVVSPRSASSSWTTRPDPSSETSRALVCFRTALARDIPRPID